MPGDTPSRPTCLTKFGGLGRRFQAGGKPRGRPTAVAEPVRTSEDNCVGPV